MSNPVPPVQGEPLAGDPQTTTPLAGTPAPKPLAGADEEPMSLDEAKKLRQEHAALRKRIKQYEETDEAAKTAALSEMEKAAKRATDAEAQAQEYQQKYLASQVKLAAQSLGFVNPELAAKLVSVDPDATPESISDALAALLKDNPYLASGTVTPAPSSNGPTNPSRTQVGLPKYTTAQLSDTDFYIKNEADIKAAMRDGRILN
jgi:hypothetical protein